LLVVLKNTLTMHCHRNVKPNKTPVTNMSGKVAQLMNTAAEA